MTTRLTQVLEEWMQAEDHTQVTAGQALGVSQTTVGRWLKGSIPSHDTLLRIAKILEVETISLYNDTADTVDVSASSVGIVVLAVDELRHKMLGAVHRIDLLAGRDMPANDRRILVLAIETLIESLDETRPLLTDIAARSNDLLAD